MFLGAHSQTGIILIERTVSDAHPFLFVEKVDPTPLIERLVVLHLGVVAFRQLCFLGLVGAVKGMEVLVDVNLIIVSDGARDHDLVKLKKLRPGSFLIAEVMCVLKLQVVLWRRIKAGVRDVQPLITANTESIRH